MARIIICDKCNKEIASEKQKISIQIKDAGTVYTQKSDLCDECFFEIIGIMEKFGKGIHESIPDAIERLFAEMDKRRQEIPRYTRSRLLDGIGMSLFRQDN
jgi:hypothetical protein